MKFVFLFSFLIYVVPALSANKSVTSEKSDAWVEVKGGEFTPLYGSQKKKIKQESFWVQKFPVTNEQFLEFVKKNEDWQKAKAKKIFVDETYLKHWKSSLELGPFAPAKAPVVNVSWFAAKAYCESLSSRLPTVNEWEFIAEQPMNGADISRVILDWYGKPTPDVLPAVESGLKNDAGVSALHGLIWEWTLDYNSTMVTGESRGDSALEKSLYCGAGSAGAANPEDYAAFMRFAFRSSLKSKYTVNNLGFRCVKEKGIE